MNFEFMQQVAPLLAIPSDGDDDQGAWLTQSQGSEQPLYGADNTPLPYYQEQGGPRQFYSTTGTVGVTADAGPVQATANPGLGPITGLRGTTPNSVAFNIPGRQQPTTPGVQPPNNLMEGAVVPNWGRRPIVQLPPDPNAPVQQTDPMQNAVVPNYGRRVIVPLPPQADTPAPQADSLEEAPVETYFTPDGQEEMPLQQRPAGRRRITRDGLGTPGRRRGESSIYNRDTQTPAPQYNPHNTPVARNRNLEYYDQMIQQSRQNGGNTLFDMFDQAGFRPPQWLMDLTGRGQTPPDSLRGRQEEPTQDARGRTGQTQRTSQWNRSPVFNLSTPQGLAEFNERTGLTLSDQVRTQAEQDALYNRGLTPTRNSRHITGEAFDVPPRLIGGLTGDNAVNAVRLRMQQGQYDVSQYRIKWESGSGQNQGTAPHVHVEYIGR